MNQSHNQKNQPQTQETTQNGQQSQTPSTSEELLTNLLAALGPVLNFHKAVETASDNDLRIFWEVRVVEGKDTPFTSMSGHSSFPGALIGSQAGQLPSTLQREVIEKIAIPLASRIQDILSGRAVSDAPKKLPAPDDQKMPPPSKPLEISANDVDIVGDKDSMNMLLPSDFSQDVEKIVKEVKQYE